MSSFTVRTAAVFTALAAAVVLAACSSPSEPAQDGGPATSDTPVITGDPAGFNDADIAFATNMVTHHKQAIDLARMVPEHSTDPDLLALAAQIVDTQQPEVNILNVFLVQWNENPEVGTGGAGDDGGHGPEMAGMADEATVARLESLQGSEFDTLWLETMIAHHRGAVDMAEAEIAGGENVDAIAMAQTMANTQKAEMQQMQQMLEGGAP